MVSDGVLPRVSELSQECERSNRWAATLTLSLLCTDVSESNGNSSCIHDKARGSGESGLRGRLSKGGRDSLEGQDRHLGEVKRISVPHLKLIQPPWAVEDKIKELCQRWP